MFVVNTQGALFPPSIQILAIKLQNVHKPSLLLNLLDLHHMQLFEKDPWYHNKLLATEY